MTEEKKETWLNILALTTVIFAVCATLASFKGSSFSTRAVLSQSQATNQWSYYQSKSVKSYLYEVQLDQMDLAAKALATKDTALAGEYARLTKEYTDNIKRYDSEKADIMAEAKRLENVRDDTQLHALIFHVAVIWLQIAILLSSIAALLKKKPLWLIGLAAGIVGLVYFGNGFFTVSL